VIYNFYKCSVLRHIM